MKITAEHVMGRKERTDEIGKTTTKKRTLSPVWDEPFTIKLTKNHRPVLTFRLFDYDVGSANDEMGILSVNLLEVRHEKER